MLYIADIFVHQPQHGKRRYNSHMCVLFLFLNSILIIKFTVYV